jgi:hypothetical protein
MSQQQKQHDGSFMILCRGTRRRSAERTRRPASPEKRDGQQDVRTAIAQDVWKYAYAPLQRRRETVVQLDGLWRLGTQGPFDLRKLRTDLS